VPAAKPIGDDTEATLPTLPLLFHTTLERSLVCSSSLYVNAGYSPPANHRQVLSGFEWTGSCLGVRSGQHS
jgi:hypothetical protein